MRRIAAVFFECPVQNALLSETGVLQMRHPLREREMPFDDGGQAMVQIGFVTRYAREELRHEIGVIEPLFLLGAQVRFRAAHPKRVAMHEDFVPAQWPAVVENQSLEREREQSVHAGIHELPRLTGLLTQKMR